MASSSQLEKESEGGLQVGFVLVSGPPGAGKSTLTSQLATRCALRDGGQLCCCFFLPISYDQIIDKSLEASLIGAAAQNGEEHGQSSSFWKLSRHLTRLLVCNLAELIRSAAPLDAESTRKLITSYSPDDSEKLSQLGDKVVSQIEASFCRNLCDHRFFEGLSRLRQQEAACWCFLVVDDVLYYESMRYDFYRFASRNEMGYLNCCFKTSGQLDFLYERNRTRPLGERLDEQVIANIVSKFESPDGVDWEKDFCSILPGPGASIDLAEVIETIMSKSEAFCRRARHHNQSLEEAARIRRQQLELSAEQNVVHESDLVIRKLVSSKLAEMGSASTGEKASVAKQLNANKSSLLNQLAREKAAQPVAFGGCLYETLNRLLNIEHDLTGFEVELKSKMYQHLNH